MIALLDRSSIYSIFGVDSFCLLEEAIGKMAPSMVEYYLSDFYNNLSESIYLNKSQIENIIHIGDYSLYKDYNENIYLESYSKQNDDYETASFW